MRPLPRPKLHAASRREAATPAAAVRTRRSPASLAFRGEVLDARTLEPLAGARAALAEPLDLLGRLSAPPPGRGRNGLADATGRFELSAPATARWWLLVHHPRYLPELVELEAAATEARVLLRRPAALHGRLLSAAGQPLPGVRVRGFCPSAVDVAEAQSGPDGGFRLEGLRPGRWILVPAAGLAEVPAGLAATALVLTDGETTRAELRASGAAATVRVRPLDARGRPCAAELLIAPTSPRPATTLDELLSRGPILAARDAGRITAVPAGSWTLYVVRETGAEEPDIRAVPIEVGECDLSLEVRLPDAGEGPAGGLRAC